ncbi:MAG: cob(I)yrinic acid a,c-diamide adenosyltransferase [Clostridiales Family XIII bacterium]|jgi:cob(I)alamin adenosyltransferase|nr:cob(I)yrinic acid a,c-diamide adenosyltransferase [Clostridiales Family XIII bacterium]
MIHLYTGDGKGKTTAGLGLALRAAGAGLRVAAVFLMKGGRSSEIAALRQLPGVTVIEDAGGEVFGKWGVQFSYQMNDEAKAEYREALRAALAAAAAAPADLLLLDEACSAVSTGMVALADLLALIEARRADTEIVLTGRDPAPELLALADYVSEIHKIKHPFDRGAVARKGIEY